MCVLHKCDVRNCCNPAHLFIGTQADNIRDMVEKRRQRGAPGNTHTAKITREEANEIKKLYSMGSHTQQSLADRYGITQPAVSLIVNNHNWR